MPPPSPEDLPDPGIKSRSPELQVDSLLSESPGKSHVYKDLIYDNVGLLVKCWFYNLNLNTRKESVLVIVPQKKQKTKPTKPETFQSESERSRTKEAIGGTLGSSAKKKKKKSRGPSSKTFRQRANSYFLILFVLFIPSEDE